jgi:hypothetical protein
MSVRTTCVVCFGVLDHLYTIPKMPITFSPSTQPFETDMYSDTTFLACQQCGCVQLKTLIDPDILYSHAHNGTNESPTWTDHHRQFAKFFLSSSPRSCIEIGGSSGVLFRLLPSDIDYACLDICPPTDSRISFIQGNCESFDFKNTKCVVMSHVFEHLYNPMKFLANLSVDEVVISIPNMQHLLNIGSSSIVFNEHTYFVDKTNVEWMFSQHGYRCDAVYEYGNHSIFMRFCRDACATPLPLENRQFIQIQMLDIFHKTHTRFLREPIQPGSFIVPGGHMGQLFYTFTKPECLIGFLDNDKNKHGLRVYGTPYVVSSFDTLKEYNGVNVYLYAGVYTDEIVAQIRTIQPTAKIHIV